MVILSRVSHTVDSRVSRIPTRQSKFNAQRDAGGRMHYKRIFRSEGVVVFPAMIKRNCLEQRPDGSRLIDDQSADAASFTGQSSSEHR